LPQHREERREILGDAGQELQVLASHRMLEAQKRGVEELMVQGPEGPGQGLA